MTRHLLCLPEACCSSDFRVMDGNEEYARLRFNFYTEQGGITLPDASYRIGSLGQSSGRWVLERDGETLAKACKPSVMFRSMDIDTDSAPVQVEPRSVITRSFNLITGGRIAGTIKPVHVFTRTTWIECDDTVRPIVCLFAFWLVALSWRRSSKASIAALMLGGG